MWYYIIQENCKVKEPRCIDKSQKWSDVGEGGVDDEMLEKCELPNIEVEYCKKYHENNNRIVLYLLQDAREGTGLVGEWTDEDFTQALADLVEVIPNTYLPEFSK